MNAEETRQLQRALNFFTTAYLRRATPLLVDGKFGYASKRRVREVKFYLGYGGSIGDQNATVNLEFRQRLWHPRSLRYSTPERIRRGIKRRREQRQQAQGPLTGVGTFDGQPVANVLIPHLTWAREQGHNGSTWRGAVRSGYRTPEESQAACYRICNKPSCPGTCAGLTSNHSGTTAERCAVDVTDYVRFGQLMTHCPHKPRIHNAIGPSDPVHFSPSGR